jgi:hypothetical protein
MDSGGEHSGNVWFPGGHMTTNPKKPVRPKPPSDLKTAGKKLWKSILDDLDPSWELDVRELHLLRQAARVEDQLVLLERAVDKGGPTVSGSAGQLIVHPAISEARQLRITQLRLLSAIETRNPESAKSSTPKQAQARRAAEARWRRDRRRPVDGH